jgi:ligand-binding sensor domain-containing protein
MWVGTGFNDRGGAARFERGPDGSPRLAQKLTRADGLAGEKVRSLYRDTQGSVWFGSERDGVAVPVGKGFRVLTTAEGLSDNEVKSFARGAGGELWLGTRSGITLIKDAERIAAKAGGKR